MAAKYPRPSLPEQTSASRDQSEPMGDPLMGDQHRQMPIKDQVSALRYSQATGMQNISQADIRLITHKAELRKADLDNLFEELGISAAEIDNGRRNADTTDFRLQSSAILRAWAIKKAKDATRNKVIEALRECDLTAVAVFLEKKFSESVNSDMSTENARTFDFHDCQEELRAYYFKEMGKVNLLPWIPEENKEMESIYVDLELVKKEESKISPNIQSNEGLVTLKTNQGQRVNRVLVTGDAGSGKSTTAGNLAYKWAMNNSESPLSKFTLVFLIRMKDIEESSLSLVDLIFQNILPEDSNVSKEDLSMFITKNAKDTLFIIDGMDEDSSGALKNKSSGINKLLHSRILCNSCVILTTRPKHISDLGKDAGHYTQVKLKGFSDKNIRKYIDNFFGDDEEKVDLLFRKLKTEPHILALASIPVLLLMICLLWEDQLTTPKTKTQLYQKTIRYLWRRYKSKMDGDQIQDEHSENEEFDVELKDLLNKLGVVALHNISTDDNILTFSAKDFGRDVCNLGCQVGILKREQSRAGLERITSVSFLHASFQDFCAAFRLAYLLDKKEKTLDDFDEKLFVISGDRFVFSWSIFVFCCGIQPEVTTMFLNNRLEHTTKEDPAINQPCDVDLSILMRHIFEGQLSYEQCSDLIPLLSSYRAGITLTDDLIPSVLYMLELYKPSTKQSGFLSIIKALAVKTGCTSWLPTLLKHTSNLDDCAVFLRVSETVTDLDMMYKALSALPNIKELALSNSGAQTPPYHRFDATNFLNFLTEKKVKLTQFRLLEFQFDEKVMVRFLSSTRTSIVRLEIQGTLDAHGQLSTINNVIEQLPNLHLKALNQLDLSVFQIDLAIKHLRPMISQMERLVLNMCGFEERHLKELFSFLSRAKKLKSIDLSSNLLSGASVQALVESLKTIPALDELILENTGLDDESVCILARFVRGKPSINNLGLDNNPGIGQAGKDALRDLPLT